MYVETTSLNEVYITLTMMGSDGQWTFNLKLLPEDWIRVLQTLIDGPQLFHTLIWI